MTLLSKRLILTALLLFLYLLPLRLTYGAACTDVFPAATTANASAGNRLTVPSFTGFLPLWNFLFNLTYRAGDYHYTWGSLSGRVKIKNTGGPSTRLYFNGNLTVSNTVKMLDAGEDKLIVVVNGNMTVNDDVNLKGFFYVLGDVTLNDNVDVSGAITATGSITINGGNVTTTYKPNKISGADFDGMCTDGPSTPTVDHFDYTVTTSASVCTPHSVTITAKDSSNNTITDYTGSISLSTSTSHGNWAVSSATNSINNGTSDDGAASYTFAAGDNGDIVLTLANDHADTLTITTNDSSASVSSTSSSITFSDNAFVIATNDSLSDDIVAGRDHSFRVQYMKKQPSPSTTTCSVATGYSGSKPLKAWYTKDASDPNGTAPKINSGSSLPASVGGANNLTLAFSSGVASFTLNTFDVGKYALNLRDDSASFASATVSGSSSTYVVRPFGLYVSATANPAASSHSGGKFKKAGEAFIVSVKGVLYESADDQYNTAGSFTPDGYPDYHHDSTPSNNANLSNNSAAPSFGDEGETIALTALLHDPSPGAGANDPGLSGTTSVSSFSSGTGSSSNVKYTEVGIIEILAQITDTNYLGSGRNVYGRSGYVGRFYPNNYTIAPNTPLLDDGDVSWTCNFTYQGQSFGFVTDPVLTVTAVNASGTATKNFGGDYWKLSAPAAHSYAATGIPAGASTTFAHSSDSTTFTFSNTDLSDYDGKGTLTIANDSFTFNRVNSRPASGDVAFSPSLAMTVASAQLTDPDGACYEQSSSCANYTLSSITGTEIRYGRVVLEQAFGSELLPLAMDTRIEYYATTGSSSAFVVNTLDANSCTGTLLGTANLNLSNYSGSISSGDTTATFTGYNSGVGIINFTAPGDNNNGQVKVTMDVPAYLEYDWADSGLADPYATADFGIYQGNDTLFYFRESYR